MIERMMRGFTPTIGAADLPGPGDYGTLSGPSGSYIGSIPLVPSMGRAREATYRAIYLTNPWVWAAVNKLSSDISRLPLHAFELDGKSNRVRQRDGQIEKMLSRPRGMSRNSFWFGTMVDRLVYGNALWEIDGARAQLSRVRWRSVTRVVEGSDGLPSYYEVAQDQSRAALQSRTRPIIPVDIVHFGLGTDPDSSVGQSPLSACRYTLALHEAIMRSLFSWFGNSMQPSGHIEVERLNREKAKELREMLTEMYASPENAGKVLVSSGKWTGITETPEHSKVVELLKLSREEVAAVYHVPPPVLGILDRATYANVKALREQYVRESVGPWATACEGDVMAQFVHTNSAWEGQFVEFQLAEQLRPDLEARALVYQRLSRFFSIDEIRKFENERPFDLVGLTDVPWVDSGALPITRAGEPTGSSALASLNGHHDEEEIPA